MNKKLMNYAQCRRSEWKSRVPGSEASLTSWRDGLVAAAASRASPPTEPNK